MNPLNDIYLEIEKHLMQDDAPSAFLEELFCDDLYNIFPFNMLIKLKQTAQSPKYHPEGNVWNHTMLVVDEAAKVKDKSTNASAFMWAALLHDIGKSNTTKLRNGKITSYNHERVGATLAKRFMREFTDNIDYIDTVVSLIRWHMQILFVVNNLPFADIPSMKAQVNIYDIALFGLCDRLGRLNPNRAEEERNIKLFLKKCEE